MTVGTGVLVAGRVGCGVGVCVGAGVGVSVGAGGGVLAGTTNPLADVVALTPAATVAPTSGVGGGTGVGIDAATATWIVASMLGVGVSGED